MGGPGRRSRFAGSAAGGCAPFAGANAAEWLAQSCFADCVRDSGTATAISRPLQDGDVARSRTASGEAARI